ncbi:YybH family protein [Rhizobium brockwellii]|uniref:YybH family protein n=1 Tax=Rhizobium brockwellii TaxID=3019932 RepID=UPI00293DF616|nr:SgcJ/EcaC family oxidoreductase [Rhizobium brockwellii]MDV4154759.1 SgcJ/EcaC family oxidoreductase [Rhizobium brockwellii]
MTENTSERTAIEATIFAYFQALNEANINAILDLYSKDPVMLPFLQPAVVGTDAVRANYEGTFQLIRFEVQPTIQEVVQISPDWAYVRTDTSGTFTPIRTGEGAPSAFHELFLLRKTGDDRWQIARYSFSPTGPLPAI